MKKILRNLDYTYCNYLRCKKSKECKRALSNYKYDIYKKYNLLILDGSICVNNNYSVFDRI